MNEGNVGWLPDWMRHELRNRNMSNRVQFLQGIGKLKLIHEFNRPS